MLKKISLLSLSLCLLFFPLPAGAVVSSTSLPVYTGAQISADASFPLQFQDISGHWANRSILRTSAVSLLRGQTATTFAPQLNVSRSEALTLAIRLKGLEAEAQTEAEKLSLASSNPLAVTTEAKWLEGYLTTAKKNGILTEAEYADIAALSTEAAAAINETSSQLAEQALTSGAVPANQASTLGREISAALSLNQAWEANVSRQQTLIWIARALELKPIYAADQQNIYTLQDWKSLPLEHIPLIEAVLQAKIISGSNQGYLNPGNPITRGELASVADRAFPLTARRLGYKLNTAWIKKIEYVYATANMNSGFNYDVGLQLQNLDGTYVQVYATSQNNSPVSTGGSFPIYQYGRLINPSLLAEGWEVEYITHGSTVVWMEVR